LPEDYYKILNVDKTATKEGIKKAYKKLAKKHHPDHGGDEEKFKEINEAYGILSDDEKRSEYDDPMKNAFSVFPNFFSGGFPFRRGRRPENMPIKGKDLRYVMVISLYESICGNDKEFEYSFKDKCSECEGLGGTEKEKCKECGGTGILTKVNRSENVQMINQTMCSHCRGRGFIVMNSCETCGGAGIVDRNEKIIIKLRSDVVSGSIMRAVGKGTSGINGGPNGDLLLKLEIEIPKKEDLTEEQLEVLKKI